VGGADRRIGHGSMCVPTGGGGGARSSWREDSEEYGLDGALRLWMLPWNLDAADEEGEEEGDKRGRRVFKRSPVWGFWERVRSVADSSSRFMTQSIHFLLRKKVGHHWNLKCLGNIYTLKFRCILY
jgi:hypothetical protein